MARPKVPLISRRAALEAALDIIDNEGLAALSIRRLGEALNVNGASLYHHFKGKDDILIGATQLALADVTAPRSDSDNWRVWLPMNAYRTRQALIAHPELISIMLRRVPMGIGTAEVEASVERLKAEGVPMSAIVPLMESFEMLAIVSALQVVGGSNLAMDNEELAPNSLYRKAVKARGLSDDELFEVVLSSVLSSVESAVMLKEASRTSKRPRPRSSTPAPAPDRKPTKASSGSAASTAATASSTRAKPSTSRTKRTA
jgi:TetR/AcrR family tetracycline transcriptional repressor